MIKKCNDLYKFIDYAYDRKVVVPINPEDTTKKYTTATENALFYKIKADHLRYVYECLSGDDGLLFKDLKKRNFKNIIKARQANEIKGDDDGEV